MGQSVSLFLVRAAGLLCAGMLLFALFGQARAAGTDNYGLTRFPGDNYDTVPAGASYSPIPSPMGYTPAPAGPVAAAPYAAANAAAPYGFAPVSGYAPAPPNAPPPGYYPTLSSGAAPQVTVSPPRPQPSYPAPQAYQPPPAYQPAAQQAAQPYGYKALPGETAQMPQRVASADPYAYYQAVSQSAAGSRGNPNYILGAGDKIRLNVFGETDLSGDFTVDGTGTLRLPLINQVRAAGYSPQQLEAIIGGALAQGYLKSPRVSVEVITYRPFYIIGAVNRPGQYPYVDHMNALNAVALAGGFNTTAVESVIFVRREGSNREVELPVDRTTMIYPGDVVKVHNTIFSDAMSLLSPFSGVAAGAATAAVIQ